MEICLPPSSYLHWPSLMTTPPEDTLIHRAQAGDADAVAALFQHYAPAIARYVGYRVPDAALVEDLTAEVFLRMVEGLPHYTITGAPFEAWLYRIAAARVADYYRQQHRRPEEQLSESVPTGQPSPEMTVEQHEEFEALRSALSQLSDEQQTIVLLRFVERKSHEEVAAITHKSVRAIATAQHRALKRLARLLGTEKSVRHYIRGKSSE